MARTKLRILLILFILLSLISIVGIYFAHQTPFEENRLIPISSYEHTGRFNYTAKLKTNEIYNKTILTQGEGTLYTRIVEQINFTFSYRFVINRSANITSDYNVGINLGAIDAWTKHYDLTSGSAADSPWKLDFSINFTINVAQYEELVDLIKRETGTTVSDFSLEVEPEISTIAETDVGNIIDSFNPIMTVKFNYGESIGDYISIEGLEHKSPGAVTRTEIIYNEWVTNQRNLSYGIAIFSFAGLVFMTGVLIKTKPPEKPEKPIEEMIKPFKEMVVGIAEEPSYEEGKIVIKIKSLNDLAKVADGLGKPILLREISPEALEEKPTQVLCVIDGLVRYEYVVTRSEEEANHSKREQASR
jgi:hypothetical protein